MLHKITPVHIASCAVSQTQMNSSINWGAMIMGQWWPTCKILYMWSTAGVAWL